MKSEEAAMYVALRRKMLDDAPWAFGASPEDDTRLDAARIARNVSHGESANNYALIGTDARQHDKDPASRGYL
jgi:hypothetical protein